MCQRIAQSGRIVTVIYTNLDEHERRFSERPLHTAQASGEAAKIMRWIRIAIVASWQMSRTSSTCRQRFSDSLHDLCRELKTTARYRADAAVREI
jgi:hypothetical protein